MFDQAGELTNKRTTMAMVKNISNTEKLRVSVKKKKKTSQFRFGKPSLFSQLK